MKIAFENKDRILKENCFIEKNNAGVYGFDGLNYIEVGVEGNKVQDLYDLKECIDKMIEEIERLSTLSNCDFEKMMSLFKGIGVNFRTTEIYGENEYQGYAIWLDKGHIEFDSDGNLTNIVDY